MELTPDTSPKGVLVIDRDPARGQHLKTVLEFLDLTPRVTTPELWRKDAHTSPPLLMTVVARDPGDGAVNTVREVVEWQADMPICLVDFHEFDAELPESVSRNILRNITSPVRYPELQDVLAQARGRRRSGRRQPQARAPELFRALIGESPGIQVIRGFIERVAKTDATVLILGETGTGKEVVARNIHYKSNRSRKPFVAVNCGAIPGDLLESELFGHEKGAFTGAISTRSGRFEMAQGGTLFLDEIGDMPLAMQVKLLRVLQDRTFERVGSNKSLKAHVRIIAATHRNLEEAIQAGRFREDLFYRLNVFPIEMPPLRERRQDLKDLINDLVNRMVAEGRPSVRFTPAAVNMLKQYPWPGNVRELANLLERLAILHPYGLVDVSAIADSIRIEGQARVAPVDRPAEPSPDPLVKLPPDGVDLKQHMRQAEINLICQALKQTNGVVAHAAKLLGVRRTTLVEKIRKYDIARGVGRQQIDTNMTDQT